jgi:hypothetical protein
LDSIRQIGQAPICHAWLHRNADARRGAIPADLVQMVGEPLPAPLLQHEFRPGLERLKLGDQRQALHEQHPAGLVPIEIVHELNRAPAAHAEDPFEHGAIDDRRLQAGQLFENLWKSK